MNEDHSAVPDHFQMLRLDGQVHVVLGAGQGIGRQTAHALAQAGAHVVCVGRRRGPTERVAQQVGGSAFIGDAQNRDDATRLFEYVESSCGRLDGIVDVIGTALAGSILDTSDEDWSWQLDNVLRPAFLALQIGSPLMERSGGGAVTLIGSICGDVVWEGTSLVYSLAKSALHHMTRVAAVHLGPRGVRVNALSLAFHATPKWQGKPAEWYESIGQGYPLRRIGSTSEVASAVLFLSSGLAPNITGQVIVLDGGLSIQSPPPLPDHSAGGFPWTRADVEHWA